MHKQEYRKLSISTVSLTKARPPKGMWKHMLSIGEHLSKEIEKFSKIENIKFQRIGLIVRYGLKNEEKPHYSSLHKDGYLPVAIEIDTHDVLNAQGNDKELYNILYRASLITLIDIARKYKLDGSYFVSELEKLNRGEITYTPDGV